MPSRQGKAGCAIVGRAVYLDWAATAPLCEEAARAMEPYMVPGLNNFPAGSNANSLHSGGRAAFDALEKARYSLMRDLGAKRPDEIVFTSGATEADNAALVGIVSACAEKKRRAGAKNFVPHLITSSIEHDAVLAAARVLERTGCEVTVLDPDRQGFVEVRALEAALKENTVLVSIHMVNNEIGSVQPVAELAAIARDAGALFHTDAVQALGKMRIDLDALGVDAASFSAHKIGGPKGSGALYLRTNTPFDPLVVGGGQESGRRSGTQNVCAAAGFAAACAASCAMQELEAERLRALRDDLYERLAEFPRVYPSVEVERGSRDFAPHVVNVCVEGFESETLILRLDMRGIAVSGGSACSSHSLDPSHVLKALGISDDRAFGSLRVSLGRYTEPEDVELFMAAFEESLKGI